MKKYFKIIGIVEIIFFGIGAISWLRYLIQGIHELGPDIGGLIFVFVFAYFAYLILGPAIGLLFLYVGTKDENETRKEDPTVVNSSNDIFSKVDTIVGKSNSKVDAIISSNDTLFNKVDALKRLYEAKEIDKTTYENAVYKVKSKFNENEF